MAQRVKYVRSIRKILTYVYDSLLYPVYGNQGVVQEIALMRGYTSQQMIDYLESKHIIRMPALTDITYIASLKGLKLDVGKLRHLGLVGNDGEYWLQDRFVLPLRTWGGIIQALICWYPDNRKYITTGTIGFTSAASFFNMESYKNAFRFDDGVSRVFVVEGIFDALSISSLGYCALGNQGLDMSSVKKEMLSRFDEVYFIPDNDKPGRMSNKYCCKRSSHLWDTENGRLIKLEGSAKDMDDVIKQYNVSDLSYLMTNAPLLRVKT